MKPKHLILFIMLVIFLVAASLVLNNRNTESWTSAQPKMGQKIFENLAVNDVAHVRVLGNGELNLVYKDGRWRVQERGGYPANFTAVRGFLLKLAELKITQSEPVEPSQLPGLSLIEPTRDTANATNTAVLIELKDKSDKAIQALLLGMKHTRKITTAYGNYDSPDGRYVMVRGNPKTVFLISDPLGDTNPKPDQWLDKTFFHIEKIKTISLTEIHPTSGDTLTTPLWTLSRDTDTNVLVLTDLKPDEKLDLSKVSAMTVGLVTPSFIDVATNTAPETTGLDAPKILTVDTFNHFYYIIKIGNKTPQNNYYMTLSVNADIPKERPVGKDEKPEDKAKLDKAFETETQRLETKLSQEKEFEKWVYIINSRLVEPMISPRAKFLLEKEAPTTKPSTNAPQEEPEPNIQEATPE